MNVLHVTTIGEDALLNNEPAETDMGGGIGKNTLTLMEGLKSYHVTSTLLVCREGKLLTAALAKGFDAQVIQARWIHLCQRPIFVLMRIRDIKRMIITKNIDVIHAHNFAAGFSAGLAGLLTGVPMIISVHQDIKEYVSTSPNRLKRLLSHLRAGTALNVYRVAALLAKRIVCVSKFVKQSIKEHHITSRKIKVIHNAINADAITLTADYNIRTKLELPPETTLIGSVGRLHPVKGYDIFIQAARQLLNIYPKTHFVLLGEGEDRSRLEALITQNHLQDNFHLLGYSEQVFDLINALDIFVLSSFSEGFAQTLLEALILKRPVVATAVGGVPEVIQHQKTGWLVKPHSVEALVKGIQTLIENQALATTLGRQGQAWVQEHFNLRTRYESFLDAYQINRGQRPIKKKEHDAKKTSRA